MVLDVAGESAPARWARDLCPAGVRAILSEVWGEAPPRPYIRAVDVFKGLERMGEQGVNEALKVFRGADGRPVEGHDILSALTRFMLGGSWLAGGCPVYRFETPLYRSLKLVRLTDEPIPVSELLALPGGVAYVETPGSVCPGLGPDGREWGGSPGFFCCIVDADGFGGEGGAVYRGRMLAIGVIGYGGGIITSSIRIDTGRTLGEELAHAYDEATRLAGGADITAWAQTERATLRMWADRLPFILYLCSTNSEVEGEVLPLRIEKKRGVRGKRVNFYSTPRLRIAGGLTYGPGRVGPEITPPEDMPGRIGGGGGGGGGGGKARHWVRAHFRRWPVSGGGHRLVFVNGHYRGAEPSGPLPVVSRVREER